MDKNSPQLTPSTSQMFSEPVLAKDPDQNSIMIRLVKAMMEQYNGGLIMSGAVRKLIAGSQDFEGIKSDIRSEFPHGTAFQELRDDLLSVVIAIEAIAKSDVKSEKETIPS